MKRCLVYNSKKCSSGAPDWLSVTVKVIATCHPEQTPGESISCVPQHHARLTGAQMFMTLVTSRMINGQKSSFLTTYPVDPLQGPYRRGDLTSPSEANGPTEAVLCFHLKLATL